MMRGSLRFAIRCKSSMLIALSKFMACSHYCATLTRLAAPGTLSVIRERGPNPKGLVGERRAYGWSNIARSILPPQKIGAELVQARTADLGHDQVDLVMENRDRLLYPRDAAGGCAVERRSSHKDKPRAEAERDQDVGAAPHTAVEHHGQLGANRLHDRR